MKNKKIDLFIYLMLFIVVIGIGVYSFAVKDTLTAKEVEFIPVEVPNQTIVGIWDEFSTNPMLKRMIFMENHYKLLLQDGETPEQNTVLESGDYKISDDGTTIQFINNGKETAYPLKIEESEGNPMTIIKLGEGSSYLYGLKKSDQTDQMQLANDLKAQMQGERSMATYLSPSGQ